MTKKYIDAYALIAECEEEIVDYDFDLQRSFIINAVPTEYIENFPAADVQEVKRGKWIDKGWIWECSVCKKKQSYGLTDYCPNCGAKMDGKESEK